MLRCSLAFVVLALGSAALPAASLAYEIKAPESAFRDKLRPDIVGVSTASSADAARAVLEALFKGRKDTQTDIQQQKFAGTAINFITALNFSLPAGPRQTGEAIASSFTSPASANRAYYITRDLTFAKDQQPSKADMVKEIMDKYGRPTIVGHQHLYYIYRKGSIISAGTKYKEATALAAIDKPLDPRAAVKLNGNTVRGSCVAVIKRAEAKTRELSAMLTEAKGANCEGVLSVQLVPGTAPDRVGVAQFALLDVKLVISAAAIDAAAVAAEQSAHKTMPKGNAPKL